MSRVSFLFLSRHNPITTRFIIIFSHSFPFGSRLRSCGSSAFSISNFAFSSSLCFVSSVFSSLCPPKRESLKETINQKATTTHTYSILLSLTMSSNTVFNKCFKPHHHHHHHHHHQYPTFTFTFLHSCFFFLFLTSAPSCASTFSGNETGDLEKRGDLFPQILRDEAVGRLYDLAKVSDGSGYLERTFLSPASMRAINIIREWMEDAGLRTWVDQMGNVHGRVEGANPDAKALLIGSHMDTVVDAGKFDGSLGIVCAISALKTMHVNGKLQKLKRPVEVIAFSDEEGVRFQTTFLGSGAISGILPVTTLEISDKRDVMIKDVLKENSIDITEESLLQLKYDPKSIWGYVEVHIEQGPVLEQVGFPLGVVKGIAGQTRLKVTVRGSQGHAGTVPMSMRQDPMAAAAELIVVMESLCKHPQEYLSYDGHCSDSSVKSLSTSLVCTVGEISTWPSASNVIPGQVTYTVDIRAIDDLGREAVIYDLSKRIYQICDKRSVSCIIEHKHDAGAVICDSDLSSQLKSAAYSALKRMEGDIQDEVPTLMSGAGHDAMAMSHLTKVGMLFVRCRGGISHSPQEHVLDNDVWAAGLATMSFLENLS